MSRRLFIERVLFAVAGLALLGVGGCRRVVREGLREERRERTECEEAERERRRGGRGFGLRRLLRRLF